MVCRSTEGRFRGAMLGLAVGDAAGTAVEFKPPGTFPPVTDITGGGAFHLAPGKWTDDTSMALCLATSLIEKRGFDPAHQMDLYSSWANEGLFSSTGRAFGIGKATGAALTRYARNRDPFAGRADPNSAGNGSLMRLAPVPLFFSSGAARAVETAAQSSLTTHGSPLATDACRYMAALIVGAVRGATKEELLSTPYEPVPGFWESRPLAPQIREVALGSFKRREPPEIKGSGFVVRTLEAALWAFHRSTSFREGLLLAVNLGDDADTTGAVYGQVAGAFHGVGGIPEEWLEKLYMAEELRNVADQLLALGPGHASMQESGA